MLLPLACHVSNGSMKTGKLLHAAPGEVVTLKTSSAELMPASHANSWALHLKRPTMCVHVPALSCVLPLPAQASAGGAQVQPGAHLQP